MSESIDGKYGLLIDYEFCTNCHTCEIACKNEHAIPEGKWGIKVFEIGPWQIDDDRWQLKYVPVPTNICDMCAERTGKGKLPACVHSCYSGCMEYGPIDKLMESMIRKPSQVIFNIPA